MSDARAPGLLLVFEGAEGVGKTTQVAALVARLRARLGDDAVASYREPGGTSVSEPIRALLLDPAAEIAPRTEALLFMAARAQLMERVRGDLAAGRIVVLDRFFLSTYAYQVMGRGLPFDEVRSVNRLATGGLTPDLTFLLVGDAATLAARVSARGALDRMERAGTDFHVRVAHGFDAALDPAWRWAHPEIGPVARVEAGGTVAEVSARVDAALAEGLGGALAARWPETFRPQPQSQ